MSIALHPSADLHSPLHAVRRRPVLAYFLFAFSVTWLYELLAFGLLHLPLLPWAIPGIFAPALAAYLVTAATDGRPGVRDLWHRCTRWRVGLRWYLLVLLALPALLVLSFVFLPDGTAGFHGGALTIALTYLAQFVVLFFLGGGQEEPGWRGFALPRMQEHAGPLAGTLLLGTLWAFWYLPLFLFVPGYDHAGSGFVGIATTFALFAFFTIGLATIMTWVFNGTGGSVLLTMLLHASVNAVFAFAPATRLAMASKDLWVAAVALCIVAVTRGRLGDGCATPEAQRTTLPGDEVFPLDGRR
jgi:membrane protease YdiL (CAAX protease family)